MLNRRREFQLSVVRMLVQSSLKVYNYSEQVETPTCPEKHRISFKEFFESPQKYLGCEEHHNEENLRPEFKLIYIHTTRN
mmetsp:Transcript_2410/g.3344  ORF Transcript_2410/g.3344 Transcript_2410/m.3344 type:complete len:80 (-) Transcript_2410:279-518(-)